MRKAITFTLFFTVILLLGFAEQAVAEYLQPDCGILDYEDQKCGSRYLVNEENWQEKYGNCPVPLFFDIIKKPDGLLKIKPMAAIDLYGDGKPWAIHLKGCGNFSSIPECIEPLQLQGYLIFNFEMTGSGDSGDYETVAHGPIVGLPPLTEGDINGDGKIGLEEAINALRITSGVKE